MAVLPCFKVAPLSRLRVIVEPTSPVPVMLKPEEFSAPLIMSSSAITPIVVPVGAVVSTTMAWLSLMEFVSPAATNVRVALLPAASLIVPLFRSKESVAL